MNFQALSILLAVLFLSACGGGGGSGTPSSPSNTTSLSSSSQSSSASSNSSQSSIASSSSSSSSQTSVAISSSSSIATVTISGKITFDDVPTTSNGLGYDQITQKPARGVSLQLLDENGVLITDTSTGDDGRYTLRAPLNKKASVVVSAQIKGANYDFSIRDNFTGSDLNRDYAATKIYALEVLPLSNISTELSAISYHAALKWNSANQAYDAGRTSPIFALLDQAYELKKYLLQWNPSVELPPLYIFWNEHNKAKSGVWWNGEIPNSSYSGYNTHGLMVASEDGVNTDEYDKTIIAHELGHYVLHVLGRDDTVGGGHSLQASMDMRQAFAEGFASYIAWSLTGSEKLTKTFGKANGQSQSASFFVQDVDELNKGWFNEVVISNVLKNIDQGNIPAGLAGKGHDFILSVVNIGMKSSDAYFSIHNFLGNALKLDPSLRTPLTSFTQSVGINSVDEWGVGETYQVPEFLTLPNLKHTYLPIYQDLILGVPKEVCLDDKITGQGNRLGVRAYLKLVLNETAKYQLTWSSADGPATVLSDNHLSTDGQSYGLGAASHELLTSSNSREVPKGTWSFQVGFYGNIFPYSGPPRVPSGCIKVTVEKVAL